MHGAFLMTSRSHTIFIKKQPCVRGLIRFIDEVNFELAVDVLRHDWLY